MLLYLCQLCRESPQKKKLCRESIPLVQEINNHVHQIIKSHNGIRFIRTIITCITSCYSQPHAYTYIHSYKNHQACITSPNGQYYGKSPHS